MLKSNKSILERVNSITNKPDYEANTIYNIISVMDYFKISWQDVTTMPQAAFKEVITYINVKSKEQEKETKARKSRGKF